MTLRKHSFDEGIPIDSCPKGVLHSNSNVTRFPFPKAAHYRTRVRADQLGKQRNMKEATMNKIIITLMAIYFVGDPHLQYLAWLGDLKLYIVAAAIALVSMPWIAEQLDG